MGPLLPHGRGQRADTVRDQLGGRSLHRRSAQPPRGNIYLLTTVNSVVYNDYVYNDIPVIAIEFHSPGHDARM